MEPHFLLDSDIVLVSGNYRLGMLGFLSLGTSASPGNYALKDQVMVMRWVRENIALFNGDPNDVTIMGLGAGAVCVHYHMISPLSRGLFHKAIIQGGSAYAPWAFSDGSANLNLARTFGRYLDCSLEPDQLEFMHCLRGKSEDEAYDANSRIVQRSILLAPFGDISVPVAEPESVPAFITKPPAEYTNPHGLAIPLIIGVPAQVGSYEANSESLLNFWSSYALIIIISIIIYFTLYTQNWS